MRIALLAPLPPEKNGIADYASHFRNALQGLGIEVATPLAGVAADSANIASRLDSVDWNAFDLVHAELGAAAWVSSSPCASCASASRACR